VVFPRERIAIFIDGCFWHGCPDHGARPQTNQSYWDAKIARNAERDSRNNDLLREAGWTVVRVWEHEPIDAAVQRIETLVRSLRRSR
jgi:DNA mismatch endonuclease (patch repair protein)